MVPPVNRVRIAVGYFFEYLLHLDGRFWQEWGLTLFGEPTGPSCADAYHLAGNGLCSIPALLCVHHCRYFIENDKVRMVHADLIFAAWNAEDSAPAGPFEL